MLSSVPKESKGNDTTGRPWNAYLNRPGPPGVAAAVGNAPGTMTALPVLAFTRMMTAFGALRVTAAVARLREAMFGTCERTWLESQLPMFLRNFFVRQLLSLRYPHPNYQAALSRQSRALRIFAPHA